jgi:ribose 1,5-bisphosphokinase
MDLARVSHRLLVVVGASGAGKDSVMGAWLAALPVAQRPHRARRTITRPAGDTHEDHEALTTAAFHRAAAAGAFAFTWSAHGLHYGIRWQALEALARGRWVVLNGSRAHLPRLRRAAPAARVLEVVASDAMRAARLATRGREPAATLLQRLARDAPDPTADLRVHNNGTLADAVRQWQVAWHLLTAPATPSHDENR